MSDFGTHSAYTADVWKSCIYQSREIHHAG
jgi:hypothetical protein